jgi:hypothetical protein
MINDDWEHLLHENLLLLFISPVAVLDPGQVWMLVQESGIQLKIRHFEGR